MIEIFDVDVAVVLGGVLHLQWVIWVYGLACFLLVVIFGSSWSHLCWCVFCHFRVLHLRCVIRGFFGGWGWMFMWGSSSRHLGHTSWVNCHHRAILFTNFATLWYRLFSWLSRFHVSNLHVIIALGCFIAVVVFSSVHRKLQGCIVWHWLLLWSFSVCSGSYVLSEQRSSPPYQNSISTGFPCYLVLILHIVICVKSCSYGRGSSSKNCHLLPFFWCWCCRHLRVSLPKYVISHRACSAMIFWHYFWQMEVRLLVLNREIGVLCMLM